jgi:hypothetical protein
VAVDHPFNAVAEMEDVEIDEEADTDSAAAHVRQQLRLVNGMEGLGRFHFHYDLMFHDQIDAISDFEFVALIDDGQVLQLRLRDRGFSVRAPGRLGMRSQEDPARVPSAPSGQHL